MQDLIGEPIREALGAEDTSFHGMGREDIDVRCLGSGRPFVLEIKRPLKRNLPTKDLVDMVKTHARGKVEVDELSWCTRKKVNEVKQSRSEKTYTIRFRAEGIDDEKKARRQYSPFLDKSLTRRPPKGLSQEGCKDEEAKSHID